MNTARKQIHFYGMKPAKSLQRLVQRQIEKWINREQSLFLPYDCSYWVKFEKESLPFIFCHLRVQVGSQTWESQDSGKTVQDALFHSMKHLKPSLRAPQHYFQPSKYAEHVA